jgi:hypothetical protein
MGPRNGWLFPLMVLAAGSVTAFGCIGIAAITGHLSLVRGTANPLGPDPAPPPAIEQVATPVAETDTAQPVAVIAQEGPGAKVITLQPGKPGSTRKRTVN